MSGPDPSGQPPVASALTPLPSQGPGSPAVVAFYLPQYHQIPENDEWWGEGFTDWVNVAAARPLYPGHPVPYVPSELGAYDLRSRDIRARQAELAREYGVYGFSYYFYRFGGRRLLEQPLELMLADGEPSLPFCLCWANEPWTRRWDGRENDILMPQRHDRVRDLAILDDLMPYFGDERYIRIDGRPLLLIYRQGLMPDAPGFVADLRAEAVRRGLPGLHLCNVMSNGDVESCAPGFDAAVEFPPHGTIGKEIRARELGADRAFRGHIYDYGSTVLSAVARPTPSFPCFPGVMPRWDNTARKGLAAHVFHGSTPESFERWLRRATSRTLRRHPDAPLVFVNSWNEWAEGAHLEPDKGAGRRYLEAVRRVVRAESSAVASLEAGRARSVEDDHRGTSRAANIHGRGEADTELRPGMPDEARNSTVRDGVAWVDEVGDQWLHGHIIEARRGQALRLRGWFYGYSRAGGRSRTRGFLLVSSSAGTWHASILERQRRTDVLRGKLASGRNARRVIRTTDRLPRRMAELALRLVVAGRDHYGFEIRVRLGDLPAGLYRIGFIELTRAGQHHVSTALILSVT